MGAAQTFSVTMCCRTSDKMDKESLIHHHQQLPVLKASICVSPHRFALLLQHGLPHRPSVYSRIRPPLVPHCIMGHVTQPGPRQHQLTRLILDQGMKVKTGCELETLFYHTCSYVIYLSLLVLLPRVTLTHASLHMGTTSPMFPETQLDVSHQGAFFSV